jgi:hypothetical protein
LHFGQDLRENVFINRAQQMIPAIEGPPPVILPASKVDPAMKNQYPGGSTVVQANRRKPRTADSLLTVSERMESYADVRAAKLGRDSADCITHWTCCFSIGGEQ